MTEEVIHKQSPNHSSRGGHKPTIVVIHGDAGETDSGTISWCCDPRSKVSYHYLIGRDGQAYQFVREQEKAWHAGVSTFHGEEIQGSVNPISIGVCFANNGKGSEFYTIIQYQRGARLVADICERHGIPLHRVRGHFEVAPGRKQDPWSHFNWRTFYLWFAFYSADREDPMDWERWADFSR